MTYLGFEVDHDSVLGGWHAQRTGRDPVVLCAQTQRALKKYLRAIHAAERTGVIRKEPPCRKSKARRKA